MQSISVNLQKQKNYNNGKTNAIATKGKLFLTCYTLHITKWKIIHVVHTCIYAAQFSNIFMMIIFHVFLSINAYVM